MIRIDIPGHDTLEIEHVLLDYNGTIAKDGILADGVPELIGELVEHVHVAVLTADTYGSVNSQAFKKQYALELEGQLACLGNGYNDVEMLDEADLAIAVLDAEGAYAGLIAHADILARSAAEGLALLLNPDRIRATLRT